MHGYSLASEAQGSLLLDVTPYALGMDVAGGFFKQIIERNATVPCSETRAFTTVKDDQTEVKIKVRQGESKLAAENEFLGEFTLTGIREAEKMTPRIDVTFKIDSSGILNVAAVDRDTGESQAISLQDYLSGNAAQPEEDPDARARNMGAGDKRKGRGVLGRLFGRGKDKAEAAKTAAPVEGPDQTGDAEDFPEIGRDAVSELDSLLRAAAHPTEVAPRRAGTAGANEIRSKSGASADASSEDLFAIEPKGRASDAGADSFAIAERKAPTPSPRIADDSLAPMPVEGEEPPPTDADPLALAERGGRAPGSSQPKSGSGAAFDAYGIAPRREGGGADLSSVRRDPAPAGADFDPYGLAERRAAKESVAPDPEAGQPRKPARLRISYKNASTFVKEYTRNVSRGGTFIKTKKPLAVGRDCVLFLTVPGIEDPVELLGVVVWSSLGADREPGKDEGMGIKFDTGPEGGLGQVSQTLQQLQS